MPSRPLITALIAVFFITETALRRGSGARSFRTGRFDRASTLLIVIGFTAAIFVPIALDSANAGELHRGRTIAGWTGIGLMALGIAFHSWAMIVLGRFYTRTLRVDEGQKLVRAGPYRILRHPGYLGTTSVLTGAALARASWLGALVVLALLVAIFGYRIRSEERMLSSAFGDEYREYAAQTWRVIPLIW
jgi:protein-S-isoprenylcysteine O-methyltransferase Ste14